MLDYKVSDDNSSNSHAGPSDARLKQLALARKNKTDKNTRKTGREKEHKQLLCVYKNGYSSEHVLRHVTHDKSGRVLARLISKGLVELYSPPMPHVTGMFGVGYKLVVLTTVGLGIARGLCVESLDYPEIKKSKINYRQAGHILEIQLAVHRLLSVGMFIDFQSERQQAQKSVKNLKRFDAILIGNDGIKCGLEVETSRKSGRELDEMQARLYQALRERNQDNSFKYEQIYYLAHPDIFDNYKKKFDVNSPVFAYERAKSGCFVRTAPVAYLSEEEVSRIRLMRIGGHRDV
jgi:hypothetical protein